MSVEVFRLTRLLLPVFTSKALATESMIVTAVACVLVVISVACNSILLTAVPGAISRWLLVVSKRRNSELALVDLISKAEAKLSGSLMSDADAEN